MRPIVLATLMRREGGTGVQTHTRTVSQYAAEAGYQVTVVTPFQARSPLLLPAFALRVPMRAVSPSAAVWWYRAGHAHYLRAALRSSLANARDAVVYAQCPVSAAVALETGRPVVLAVHFNGSQADEWAGKGEVPAGGRLHRSITDLESDVIPRVQGLVYVSEDSRRQVEARVLAASEVPSVVIPNPVAPPAPHSAPPSDAAGDLITIGSLEPRKNQRYLLEVVAEAHLAGHRCSLTVVGDGPDRSALQSLATRLGIRDSVRFLGYRSDARALLPAHKLYVHTATKESFGMVLVEAMGAGLPVIAGQVGGIPEVVRHGVDGLFWPLDDARAAASTLAALLSDDGRRKAMSTEAVRHAAEFRPERLGPRLLAFLDHAGQRSRIAAPSR